MAQDVASPTRGVIGGPLLHRVVERLRQANLLPPSAIQGHVVLTPPLVTFVAAVGALGTTVAFLTVRGTSDWWTLSAGSIATFIMAVYAVRSLPDSTFVFSPSILLNLGLSVTLGPVGAAGAALAEAFGNASRTRNGWFKTIFNIFNHFLSNVSASGAFAGVTALAGVQTGGGKLTVSSASVLLVAGLAAGITQFIVNHSLLAAVIRVSNPEAPMTVVMRNSFAVLPYYAGYGIAAFAFVIMREQGGYAIGFMSLIAPIILLQVYLGRFAREVKAHQDERDRHAKEREDLLQKEAAASYKERQKIARDLHDGPVQDLAGIAFALSAEASQLKAKPEGTNGQAELLELLENSSDETRKAMKDLRTLIIELSPPTLRREGLHAALLEVLREIKKKGTRTKLDLPTDLRLREDRAALIFRVAQEILRNVAAHAEAKNVTVELVTEERSAILSIQDDGKGFSQDDVARRRAEGHLGTQAIVDLAEEAGGTLTVDSEPGRGTLVVLTLPIE